MTAILEGIYKQGRIELRETPTGMREGPVRVVLIAQDQPQPASRYLTFGKYPTGRQATLDDFREAEWHGEKEFDDPYGQ